MKSRPSCSSFRPFRKRLPKVLALSLALPLSGIGGFAGVAYAGNGGAGSVGGNGGAGGAAGTFLRTVDTNELNTILGPDKDRFAVTATRSAVHPIKPISVTAVFFPSLSQPTILQALRSPTWVPTAAAPAPTAPMIREVV